MKHKQNHLQKEKAQVNANITDTSHCTGHRRGLAASALGKSHTDRQEETAPWRHCREGNEENQGTSRALQKEKTDRCQPLSRASHTPHSFQHPNTILKGNNTLRKKKEESVTSARRSLSKLQVLAVPQAPSRQHTDQDPCVRPRVTS